MENVQLLVDLAFVAAAALVGGFAAHFLKQPVILGYLLAGIVVGPYTPGPVSSLDRVQTLANLGVALLMFALGTEFSLAGLRRVRGVAVGGGLAQIALTILLGTLVGLAMGQPLAASIFLGGVIAISSSILILKLLMARDETESIVGRVALGTGIVQDLATIVLVIVLPALAAGIGPGLLGVVGLALLKGGLFLAATYFLGTRLVPPLLAAVARAGSRELFLLTILALAVGTAAIGHQVGISFALGAFVAGLVVAESEFSGPVLDEIIPVRDIFSAVFFVSIGMLMNPTFVLAHAGEIAVLAGAILLGKFALSAGVVRLFGYGGPTAARVGLLLAQIGEFSFVLASAGLATHAIDSDLYGLILAAALVTLFLNPLLVGNAERAAGLLGRLTAPLRRALGVVVARWWPAAGMERGEELAPAGAVASLSSLKRHVIVCGYGRVGHELAGVLHRRGFPFAVIDYYPARVEEARRAKYLSVQGDATNPAVLERAGVARARMLAITVPDLPSAEQIIKLARQINPALQILARTHDARAISYLKLAGADEVVQPEFEAGLEMVRHTLRVYGVSSFETQSILGGRRKIHYTGSREPDLSEDSRWA